MTNPWAPAFGTVLLGLALSSGVEAQSGSLDAWLRGVGGFSNSDMRDLRSGSPIVKILRDPDPADLTILSAIRVATTPARFISVANRPVEFLAHTGITAAGEVHIPPRFDDFSQLHVPNSDVSEIAACSPGSCKVKLPAQTMLLMAGVARGSPADARAGVTAHFRNMLFTYASRFLNTGVDGLPLYADKATPTAADPARRAQLKASPQLFGHSASLLQHLRTYPSSEVAGITDRLAWTSQDLGPRPTIRLFHLALTQPLDAPAVDAMVAIEQLYASHYVLASTGFVSLITDGSIVSSGARYVLVLTRYRFDEPVTGVGATALRQGMRLSGARGLRALQEALRP